ncbi:MAG TPA: YtxH domain-containing protein [Ktedonobacterales bacterium]|jgi:hypothetical protein
MSEFESLFDKRRFQQVPARMSDMRRASEVRIKRARRWQRWFVRGMIVGAAWAVLTAPEPGWEARQKVGRLLRQFYQQGETALTRFREQQPPSGAAPTTRLWAGSETLTPAAGHSRGRKEPTELVENGNQ